MFIKLSCKINSAVSCLKSKVKESGIVEDPRGAEMVQVLIVILIVIIVGGIAVGILRVAAPDLINDTVTRIRTVFEL